MSTLVGTHEALRGGPFAIVNDTLRRPDQEPELHHPKGLTLWAMGSRGAGSLRQRDTGRWEVRVSVGVDPVSGRSISRSVTVVGELADARRRQEELAAQAAALRNQQS